MRITRDQIDARHHGWTLLTAHCLVCGGRFTTLIQRHEPGVHHRCGTGVIGPVWTVVQPATPARALHAEGAA